MNKPKEIKTTIRVPAALWAATRKRAIDEGKPAQNLVLRALRAYLKGGRR